MDATSGGNEAVIHGHFHAVALTYHPLSRGEIDLVTLIRELCEEEIIEVVMHLLQDNREIVGVGESEFVRGAAWVGPMTPQPRISGSAVSTAGKVISTPSTASTSPTVASTSQSVISTPLPVISTNGRYLNPEEGQLQ
jgi:hypothetical protein